MQVFVTDSKTTSPLSLSCLELPNDEEDCIFLKIDLSDPIRSLQKSANKKPQTVSMYLEYINPLLTSIDKWKSKKLKTETMYVVAFLVICTIAFITAMVLLNIFQDYVSINIANWLTVATYIASILIIGLLWVTRGQLTRPALIDLIEDFNKNKALLNPVAVKLNEYSNFLEVRLDEVSKGCFVKDSQFSNFSMASTLAFTPTNQSSHEVLLVPNVYIS